MRYPKWILFFLVSIFLSSFYVPMGLPVYSVSADDWPMLNHDLNHTGYSTSTAPATNSTRWTFNTSSQLFSPVVANGRLYIGSRGDGVYCLNASTGAQIWNYITGALSSELT